MSESPSNDTTSISAPTPGSFPSERAVNVFCVGIGLVMLSMLIGIGQPWNTFVHMWKAELAASLFLLGCLAYAGFRGVKNFRLSLTDNELKFLVLPICVFVIWSGFSIIWAPSWKSALHHTALWIVYLVFYIALRQILETGSGFKKLMITFAIVIACLSVPAITQYVAFQIFGGAKSLGVTNAKYGEAVNTLMPLLLIAVVRLPGRKFWLGTGSVVLGWLLIVCGLGRINLFLFACGCIAAVVLVIASGRFRRYRLKLAIVFAAIVVAPVVLNLFSIFDEKSDMPVVSRITNRADTTSSNSFRILMINLAGEMLADNPIVGIGADNFGFQANHYRKKFARENPDDPSLKEAEDNIPERAHNEYLQIAAELGVIGLGIFLWFLFGILFLTIRALKNISTVPAYAPAAVIGLGAFLVSTMVSSFSFRFVQSGFAFFFVLAVASKISLKDRSVPRCQQAPNAARFNLALSVCVIGCATLAAYSIVRATSVAISLNANSTQNLDEAARLYDFAIRLDDENPDAHLYHGLRLFNEAFYPEAVFHLDKAIKKGGARASDFSYLASAQILAGDDAAAENTMSEAVLMYPSSTFVLARHAALLAANGKAAESAAQMERARRIDPKAANTWWTFINDGPEAASRMAFKDENFIEVMDLQPISCIYAVVAERDARFPNEKRKIPF